MPVVITISREEGSNGDEIAHAVAQRLGIPLVAREVIEEAARRAGLPQEVLDAKEKEASRETSFTSSDMTGLLRRSQTGRRQQMADSLYYRYLSEVVREISASPCVIVGRGAQFILKDRDDVLDVHIYAPEEVRIVRVMQDKGVSRDVAAGTVRRSDQERSAYVKKYFNNANWRNPDYYNLMIDTGSIAPETATEIILTAAKAMGTPAFNRPTDAD